MKSHPLIIATWAGLAASGLFGALAQAQSAPELSHNQEVYENFELHGGTYGLGWYIPFGGGTLVPGQNDFYAISSGGLSKSPATAGPELQTPSQTTLDPALTMPYPATSRVIQRGQILLLPGNGPRRVSYENGSVRTDYLDSSGQTRLISVVLSDFETSSLEGRLENSPEALLASYPIKDWIKWGNFAAGAKWQRGSAFVKRKARRLQDTFLTEDCGNEQSAPPTPGNVAVPVPCYAGVTIEQMFPISLGAPGGHPFETDYLVDGTITTLEGLRAWVANLPRPADQDPTRSYRVYYEYGGNVYEGFLEKAGSPINYDQTDGSYVSYSIGLNAAAVKSVQGGLITGTVTPGATSEEGSDREVRRTLDLFGIGGHGPNGSLAPEDLRSHYGITGEGLGRLTGKGQTIAIVDAPGSGDVVSDLKTYSDAFHLPQCNVENHCFTRVDLSAGAKPGPDDWGGEVALDTQMVHGVAPKARIILVTAPSDNPTDLMNAINVAAAQPGVTAVSMSFDYDAFIYAAGEDPTLQKFQANDGIAFFASAGDNGSSFGLGGYPASSPYVTGVGGTRINSVEWKSPASASTEVAWQFTGGGTSDVSPAPAWQLPLLPPSVAQATAGARAFPDVAAVADFQHSAVAVYYEDGWRMEGGTSASAPIWAGIAALFGQHLAKKHRTLSSLIKNTPGGFNGLLYQAKVASGFHDITEGGNDLDDATPCPLCSAGPGFDALTGLGTPDVARLLANF